MIYKPLKNKKDEMIKDFMTSNDKKNDFCLGFKKGVDDSFNVFSSYIYFFKKYKNNVKLLMDEQKDIWLKFVKYYENKHDTNASNYLSRYNNWLFDYIFSDINNVDSDDFLSL